MKQVLQAFFLSLFLVPWAAAGTAVIVHPSVTVDTLSVDQVSQLYMGRAKALPDGTPVLPLDFGEGEPARLQFVQRVLGKTEQQLRSHWSRMVFTGKGLPPRTVGSVTDMLRIVATTPGFIGYVDTADLGNVRVKVLYRTD